MFESFYELHFYKEADENRQLRVWQKHAETRKEKKWEKKKETDINTDSTADSIIKDVWAQTKIT